MPWGKRFVKQLISNVVQNNLQTFNYTLSIWFTQVGKFTQLVSTFLGGFVIAFIKGWLLTLVMITSIPPLVIAGGIMSVVLSSMASRGQNAYSKAANVVEQTIGSIRTVIIKYLKFYII